MTDTKLGGVLFLILSCCYGVMANDIPLLFDDASPFTSRTLPVFLSIAGIITSLLMIILPAHADEREGLLTRFRGGDWFRIALLSCAMVLYGLTIDTLGFIPSTVLFLSAGFWILQERRFRVIVLAAVPVVLVFWLLMTRVLGLYLAPGILF